MQWCIWCFALNIHNIVFDNNIQSDLLQPLDPTNKTYILSTAFGCIFLAMNHTEWILILIYRSGTVNSNTVNSKFHLIRSFFEIFARFLSFHV